MKKFGFGFLCILFFVSVYGGLRDLSVDIQKSTTFSAAAAVAYGFISLYALRIISQPGVFKNEYAKSFFNGAFHTINMIFLSSVFRDYATILISGNRYAEGNFGDKTYLDWIFVNLSGILLSLVVFHIAYRVLLSKKSED